MTVDKQRCEIDIAGLALLAMSSLVRIHRRAPPALIALGAGVAMLSMAFWLSNIHPENNAMSLALATGRFTAHILAYALFGVALLREPSTLLRRIAPILFWPLLLWALWTAPQGALVMLREWTTTLTNPLHYGSDAVFDAQFNAWLVLHGQNPYAGQWLTSVTRYFHVIAITPIARGMFASPHAAPTAHQLHLLYNQFARDPSHPPVEIDPRTTHSYPASSFLLLIPAVWAGLPSVAPTFAAALVAIWMALVVVAPSTWRWLAILGPLLMINGLRQIGGGDFEILPLALTLGAWLARERRWGSSILLGLAATTKQTAWFAAPFYLLWVWRTYGPREALLRGGLAAATFALVNLPWIILSPREWLASITLPASLPLLPDGVGLIGLSIEGGLPFAPPWFYTLLELATLAALLGLVWRCWSRAPYLAILLPLAPLLLAWRTPDRYFELLPLTALAAFLLTQKHSTPASAVSWWSGQRGRAS
jgi:hypothetical protein